MTNFEIKTSPFNLGAINTLAQQDSKLIDWPVVYTINDQKLIYIGGFRQWGGCINVRFIQRVLGYIVMITFNNLCNNDANTSDACWGKHHSLCILW
jgi:hypothetical protein